MSGEEREALLTKAALAIDALFLRVAGFDESWDRGYVQGVKDSAYAVRELRATPVPSEATEAGEGERERGCGAASEHENMAALEHLRRCPICNLRFDRAPVPPEDTYPGCGCQPDDCPDREGVEAAEPDGGVDRRGLEDWLIDNRWALESYDFSHALMASDWLAALLDRERRAGKVEGLRESATTLRAYAAQEFDLKGPKDARGAAIWDVANLLSTHAELAENEAGQ